MIQVEPTARVSRAGQIHGENVGGFHHVPHWFFPLFEASRQPVHKENQGHMFALRVLIVKMLHRDLVRLHSRTSSGRERRENGERDRA